MWRSRVPSSESGFRLVNLWRASHSLARKAVGFCLSPLGDFFKSIIVDCLVCSSLKFYHEASYHLIVGLPTWFPTLILPVTVFTRNSSSSYRAIGKVLSV